MDFFTALNMLDGPATAEIINNIYFDWRDELHSRKGTVVNDRQEKMEIQEVNGAFSIPDSCFSSLSTDTPGICLRGKFVAESLLHNNTHDLLFEHEKIVYTLLISRDSCETYFFEFDFYGYAMKIWPGLYSFYAFIIDPYTDRVIGIGYPYLNVNQKDPNPLIVEGGGVLEIDFIMLNADDLFTTVNSYFERIF